MRTGGGEDRGEDTGEDRGGGGTTTTRRRPALVVSRAVRIGVRIPVRIEAGEGRRRRGDDRHWW